MSAPDRVPRALRLAARLLPRDARDEVLGDLVEVWRERRAVRSRLANAWWLLRQPWVALRTRIWSTWRPRLGFSWLDVKLAVRMLGKQPILTAVAGATLALGIPASLLPAHVMSTFFDASLPVDEGERIFGIRNWDLERGGPSDRLLHDYAVWREELSSFQVIAAARSDPWNVHSPDGRAEEVRGAEVTASAFDLLRVPPLMGRTLGAADEVEGADDVVVISEDLWASRFGRDAEIVGKTIGVGRKPHTVVGVMPAGFLFPGLDHLWLPLRADPADYAVGSGPDLFVYGRLADGVSREQADAELAAIGGRLASEWPETHQTLRPETVSIPLQWFGEPASGMSDSWEVLLVQLLGFSLLAIACGNVGTLILARTATRTSEIAVRTALGASRARVLGQLFIECLVLAVGATAIGLVVAQVLLERYADTLLTVRPYWMDLGIGLRSISFALGLAAVCAVLAGVAPAVRATSPNVQANLQRNAAGTTVRFGPFTTLLIVAEVAISVGFLSLGTAAMISFMRDRSHEATIDVDRYLLASLRTPWVDPTEAEAEAYRAEFGARVAASHLELRDRLAAHPTVRHVGMGQQVAGTSHPERRILVEESDGTREARTTWGLVHFDYFRDMGIEVVHGRDFTSADVDVPPGAHRPAVIVNEQLAQRVFGGGDVVGRRIRYHDSNRVCFPGLVTPGSSVRCEASEQWHEIVGVVETFGTNLTNPTRGDAIFHPVSAAELHPMRYVVEVTGDPVAFIRPLRQIAADVDADAMIQSPATLTEVVEASLLEDRVITLFVFILSSMGVVLAATGLYALMSFTVSQRTREIGIRTALGAGARNVVATIARRAAVQLLFGVAFGSVFGVWIVDQVAGESEFAVPSVPALVLGVCLAVVAFSALCCAVPTLRGLRIQPTEALREA